MRGLADGHLSRRTRRDNFSLPGHTFKDYSGKIGHSLGTGTKKIS